MIESAELSALRLVIDRAKTAGPMEKLRLASVALEHADTWAAVLEFRVSELERKVREVRNG